MQRTPRLRELRERAALSQEDVAARAGVARATIADLEAGKRPARPSTIRKLAKGLDVEVTELYAEPESRKTPAPPSSQERLLDNGVLEEARRAEWDAAVGGAHQLRELDKEAALAVLFRELARRARRVVERSRREGPSAELGEDAAALHAEASALYQLRGRRDIFGTGSEELADAVDSYEEVESTIQAMLRQDVEATDEERDTARRFRPGTDDARKHGEADAS
jgi:transcriptional regulator with XRE-family HTH domain